MKNRLETKTDRGMLIAEEYDDVMANGIKIRLNDDLVVMAEVYRKTTAGDVPEFRLLIYADAGDEPTDHVTIEL